MVYRKVVRKVYHEFSLQKEQLLKMTDQDFEEVIGRKIDLPIITRPYNLNTPFQEYKTFWGKFLFGVMKLAMKINYNMQKIAPKSENKETNIKNAYFGMKTMEAMSLRSTCYVAEGMMTQRMALGLLDIANNRPLKGLWKLITKEKE